MSAGTSFRKRLATLVVLLASGVVLVALGQWQARKVQRWESFTQVRGQPLPVPDEWLRESEARVAHDLVLPNAVPRPVAFDFAKARLRAIVPGNPSVRVQYFRHLCRTEAGEWVFRREQGVKGLYFARPSDVSLRSRMLDPYGPEMPWIERVLVLMPQSPRGQGAWFVSPPHRNYEFVEQPRSDVDWLRSVETPYVRLFGYAKRQVVQNGEPVNYYEESEPMRVLGIDALSARHGMTWRGVRRVNDREHGIAGGEVLIYDIETGEILAARRQFVAAANNRRSHGGMAWEIGATCPQVVSRISMAEFSGFAARVLVPPLANRKAGVVP